MKDQKHMNKIMANLQDEAKRNDFSLKNLNEISAFLGITPNTLYVQRNRGLLPYRAIVETCIKHDLSIDNVFKGDKNA